MISANSCMILYRY